MINNDYSKTTVEKIFKKNGIKWDVKNFGTYVDPKCKTSNSIYNKLLRLYNNQNKNSYSVMDSNIDDLLRMTIIVDYANVANTISVLKQQFPDLTGYLKIEAAGYRGVHLNLKIDGLPCEIQLAPKIVVMAVDFLHTLYEKWRSFNYETELAYLQKEELEILNGHISEPDKTNQLNIIKFKMAELEVKKQHEAADFKLRNKTYAEVFAIAEFSKYQNVIQNQLNIINYKLVNSTALTNQKLLNILNKNLLTNGQLDKNKVKEVAELISQNIAPFQKKLVNSVKDCLGL